VHDIVEALRVGLATPRRAILEFFVLGKPFFLLIVNQNKMVIVLEKFGCVKRTPRLVSTFFVDAFQIGLNV
jgi:hypothetical protein